MPRLASKEFQEFARLTDRLLSVPHHVIKQRIEQYRERAAKNPHKARAETEARLANG
jgi:hypothetical protein